MMSAARCLIVAALLLSQPVVQAGNFLAGLKKIVPKSTAALTESVPSVGKTSEDLAKAISQEVAKSIPADVADKIGVSALEEGAPKKDGASNITGGAAKGGIKGTAASPKDLAQQVIHDSLQEAETSAVAREVVGAVEKAPEALDAVRSATPDEVASALREATPQVVSAVNRASLHVSDAVRDKSPKVVADLAKTTNHVADRLDGGEDEAGKSGPLPSTGFIPDGPEVRKASQVGLVAVVILVLTVAAGVAVFQSRRPNAGHSRVESGPALLSEVLAGTS